MSRKKKKSMLDEMREKQYETLTNFKKPIKKDAEDAKKDGEKSDNAD